MAEEAEQEPVPGGQGPQAGQAQGGQEPEGEGGRAYTAAEVRALREEAAGYRRRLREAEGRLKALEEQQSSGAERQEQRLRELEEENTRLRREGRLHQVERAALRAGAVDPGDVAALVGPEAEGEEEVERAVAELRRRKPYLFGRPGAGSADGGAGGIGAGAQDMNTLLRRAAGKD